ncbi:hypothetical protein [Actinocrispum wychmicini]|uniref:Uncharacterized protein n=1 Tax=Actinocrispum wychmicini TaxID=1213861 RepID=A0A4R2IYC9_9PSEU|nr:hypothetical protein [Actinocrispum wychmicini]TCO48929.1 hypothetical protein EV192_115150 [Actinocrispum wychmicini]
MKAARGFVRQHGPSKAVVEPIGLAGARVVLVGQDGAMGDVLVPSTEAAEALIAEVTGLEAATWDADTVNGTKIGAAHRRKMAGRRLFS